MNVWEQVREALGRAKDELDAIVSAHPLSPWLVDSVVRGDINRALAAMAEWEAHRAYASPFDVDGSEEMYADTVLDPVSDADRFPAILLTRREP